MKIGIRIYLEAVKVLWKNKLLIVIPLFNLFLAVFVLRINRNYPGLLGILAELFELAVGVFVVLIIIASIFKDKNVQLSSTSSWDVATRYFWRFIGINFASVVIILLVLSPFCFFLFLLATAELNYIFSVFYIFVYFLFMILFFGANSLGTRILIGQDKRIVESMWAGFQELNKNRSYYIWFIVITFFLLSLPSFVINISGLKQLGLTIYSVPFVPFDKFWDNYLLVMGSVSRINWIFGVYRSFMSPINIAAITLVYLKRSSLQSSIVNPQLEIRN